MKQPKPLPLPYSNAALRIARQYDRPDSYGQATVSAVVREELNRCEAPAQEAKIIELPHSLNPRYPDIVPAGGEAIVCKGLVLGKLAAAWIVSKKSPGKSRGIEKSRPARTAFFFLKVGNK